MNKNKILFVSQEINPYIQGGIISEIARNVPQYLFENEVADIRVFMPRYGKVNPRKHCLHEVIRLSGMNIIIDETDHPLIIKVASIPKVRMQVYFIDGIDYFKRPALYNDDESNFFEDNDERMIFFARGVLETVKKLRWSPDLVHCHGWFTSVIPLYIKKAFKEDPIFNHTKVVTSIYENYETKFRDKFIENIVLDGISEDDISVIKEPTYENIINLATNMSDGVIFADDNVSEEIKRNIGDKPFINHSDNEDYIQNYLEFYEQFFNNE
jgi:starch synthase